MRLACISDIHSNLPALKAVLADIKTLGEDLTLIVAGDFINNGPFPNETLALLRQHQPIFIRGNHEEYVLNSWKNLPLDVPAAINAPSRWTANQLSNTDLEWLDGMPERMELDGPDGARVIVLHASPSGNRRGIFDFMSDDQIATRFGNEPLIPKTLYLFGHTHRPLLRRWRDVTLAGDGSVGQAGDGNIDACYLVAEWDAQQNDWQVEHRRVAYDRREIIEAMHRHADFDQGGPIIKLITQNFVQGRDIGLPHFVRDYITEGSWADAPDPLQHLDVAVNRHLNYIQTHGLPEFALI